MTHIEKSKEYASTGNDSSVGASSSVGCGIQNKKGKRIASHSVENNKTLKPKSNNNKNNNNQSIQNSGSLNNASANVHMIPLQNNNSDGPRQFAARRISEGTGTFIDSSKAHGVPISEGMLNQVGSSPHHSENETSDNVDQNTEIVIFIVMVIVMVIMVMKVVKDDRKDLKIRKKKIGAGDYGAKTQAGGCGRHNSHYVPNPQEFEKSLVVVSPDGVKTDRQRVGGNTCRS